MKTAVEKSMFWPEIRSGVRGRLVYLVNIYIFFVVVVVVVCFFFVLFWFFCLFCFVFLLLLPSR